MRWLMLALALGVVGQAQAVRQAHVEYSVQLPETADASMVYHIDIFTEDNADDWIMPFRYLIEWQADYGGFGTKGFNAYFDGNYYRSNGGSLTEFHSSESVQPFLDGGVHMRNMFFTMIPEVVEDYIENVRTAADDQIEVEDTPSGVRIIKRVRGLIAERADYSLDSDGRPVHAEIVSAPDQQGEQTIVMEWTYNPDEVTTLTIDDATLRGRYADTFAEHLTLEELEGQQMPSFSERLMGGERLTYRRGAGFDSPVVLVLLNDPDEDAFETISTIAKALPQGVELIPVFAGNRADIIAESMGNFTGLRILYSARGMMKRLGVTTFPTLIYINPAGTVEKVDVVTTDE